MRLVALVLVLAGTSACTDDKLGPMRAIKAEMCACKTAACADAAMKRVPPPAGSADHRAQKLAKEIQDCLVKAYDRDRPTTDPDAQTDTDESGSAANDKPAEASAGETPNPSIAPPPRP